MGLIGSAFAADNLSYNYVQASAVHENDLVPNNGSNVKLSFDVGSGLFAQADIRYLQSHDVRAERYNVGFGYHYSLSNNTSVYGLASAVGTDSNVRGIATKYGFAGEAGLRTALTPTWEVGVAVGTEKLNLDEGTRNHVQNYGKLETAYNLTSNLAVVASYKASKVEHEADAGVRLSW